MIKREKKSAKKWRQLLELYDEVNVLSGENSIERIFSVFKRKFSDSEIEEIRDRIGKLKKSVKSLSKDLDELALAGKRDQFPREASFLPCVRRLTKKWEERLNKNII